MLDSSFGNVIAREQVVGTGHSFELKVVSTGVLQEPDVNTQPSDNHISPYSHKFLTLSIALQAYR